MFLFLEKKRITNQKNDHLYKLDLTFFSYTLFRAKFGILSETQLQKMHFVKLLRFFCELFKRPNFVNLLNVQNPSKSSQLTLHYIQHNLTFTCINIQSVPYYNRSLVGLNCDFRD